LLPHFATPLSNLLQLGDECLRVGAYETWTRGQALSFFYQKNRIFSFDSLKRLGAMLKLAQKVHERKMGPNNKLVNSF
jgi:hypothetical protein